MLITTKKEFENQVFKKEACLDSDLKHRLFSHCTFENCDFSQSSFISSKFLECAFLNTNLSLVKFDGCRLQGIFFEKCKFVGVNFGKCEQMFLSLQFKGCLIDTCNFSELNLKGTLFQECVIRDTYFTNANLTEADFKGSDLRKSTFHNTDLTKANLQGAVNYSISPLTNKLQKAKFSKPEVLSLLDHLGIIIE
jgi:fluoroquinolone resistance protein